MARYNPKKIRNAYVRSTLSITLVMFLIGFITFMLYNVYKAAGIVIDNTSISVMIKDDITEKQKKELESFIKLQHGVIDLTYISKDDALAEFRTFTGENISKFINENPLPASYTIKLDAVTDYKTDDIAEQLANDIAKYEGVTEVLYQKELLAKIVRNVNILYLLSSIFFIVLIVISIMLINNTINMAVYSKRFLIKTMCLAGATESFVRKPFIALAIKQAMYSSIITWFMLSVIIYFFFNFDLMNFQQNDIISIGYLFLGVMIISLVSCITLTRLAVNKNMNLNTHKLHTY